jgi:anti-anti-sigma factor
MFSPAPRARKAMSELGANSKLVMTPGCLQIMANLQRADIHAFQEACGALGQAPETEIILDMTRCTYVNSLVVGILVDAITQMQTSGKQVTLIVSPEVGHFLNMARLYHLFSYQIADAMMR